MTDLAKYYQILGLETNASPERVKQAYRDLVQVWHPDRFAHDERLRRVAQEKLKEINGAYEIIKAALFEAGIILGPAQSGESGFPSNDVPPSGSGKGFPQSGAKRGKSRTTLSFLALAVIVAAALMFLEKARRNDMGISSEPNPIKAKATNVATNQVASIVTDSPPPKQVEALAQVPVPRGWALSLDGRGYVRIATTDSLTGTFTVECWASTRSYLQSQTLLSSRTPKEWGFDMQFDGARIHGDIGNGSGWLTDKADASVPYLTDTWYHIAYVVTPRLCVVYVNGIVSGSNDFVSNNPIAYDASHQLFVGAHNSGSGYLDGAIAELRIWETARSQAQIQANMNRRLTGSETGLRGYWRFDEGSGKEALDRSGHGLNGVLVNNAAWSSNAPPLAAPGN